MSNFNNKYPLVLPLVIGFSLSLFLIFISFVMPELDSKKRICENLIVEELVSFQHRTAVVRLSNGKLVSINQPHNKIQVGSTYKLCKFKD